MAALAFAVGAYLVQTRLPNANCSIDSTVGVAELRIASRTLMRLLPLLSDAPR